MSSIVIYHNPECGTSRNNLAMIRASGKEPRVIEYLRQPPSRDELTALLAAAGLTPRAALRRRKGGEDTELDDPALSDADLVTRMVAAPILINRPFVVTPLGTRLCRPSERVLEILPNRHFGRFTKEDGEVIETDPPETP
jgi:arsenate reductase